MAVIRRKGALRAHQQGDAYEIWLGGQCLGAVSQDRHGIWRATLKDVSRGSRPTMWGAAGLLVDRRRRALVQEELDFDTAMNV